MVYGNTAYDSEKINDFNYDFEVLEYMNNKKETGFVGEEIERKVKEYGINTDFIKIENDISRINVYGQEKEPATYRLAKMNLALRGISHNLGTEAENTFRLDLHKGISFDYIMANPPFNLKGWFDPDTMKTNDSRWVDYALPPESNANYA